MIADIRISISNIILFTGLTLFQFLSILFILSQIQFFFHVSINVVTFIISACISVLILYSSGYSIFYTGDNELVAKKKAVYLSFIVFLLSLGIIILSIIFGISYLDPSHDSNAYHKPYALFFVHGWNPVLSDLPPIVFGIQGLDYMNNTYPKGAELIASYFYLISGVLESVKAINLIIGIAAILLSYSTFRLFLPDNKIYSVILSLVVVFNPVWVTQSTQFYIDGFYYEVLLIIICLSLYYVKTKGEFYILFTLILGLVLGLSIKGSSLLVIPILYAMFLFIICLYRREKIILVLMLSFIPLLVLSLVTGYSPYIVNYSKYSDPLGESAITVDESDFTLKNVGYSNFQIPDWLVPKELFLKTLLSPVSQQYTGMKNPLIIDIGEFSLLSGENRINAYGPFLGLIIILSTLVLLVFLLFNNTKSTDSKILLICALFVFLTVILHPAVWWARLVPQFYFIFICIAMIGFLSKLQLIKNLSILLLGVLVINAIILCIYWYPEEAEVTTQIDDMLKGINDSTFGPVLITAGESKRDDIKNISYLLTNIVSFHERGIPWIVGDNAIINKTNYSAPLFFYSKAIVMSKPPNYHIGDTIPATVLGRYAIDGFSETLGTHIWTDMPEASLNLIITDPPEMVYLLLKARPYHIDDQYINQTIWVSINNLPLSKPIILVGLTVNTVVIPLPSGILINGTNIIKFTLPDAKRLSTHYYGISVRSITLTDTLPLNPEID